MKKDNGLYISFDYPEYKKGKGDLLKLQIDLLNCIKHLQNLKQIKQEKSKLKFELNRVFLSLSHDLDVFEEGMPQPVIPRNLFKHEHETAPIDEESHEDRKMKSIEHELEEINAKLRKLNAI